MSIRIKLADTFQPDHAAAIILLLDYYASDPAGGGTGLSSYSKQNLIPTLQQRSDVVAVLAFDEKKPIGLILCFEGFSSFLCKPLLNIHDVIVLKAYRSQGIAQLMLSEVEKIARHRGYCKLTLEVLEGNTAAQMAYRKFGFCAYELDPGMGQAMFWEKRLN